METMKFEKWAEIWIENKKDYVKESTYANYLLAMHNHIIPAFYGVEMSDITNHRIQEVIRLWSKAGKLEGKGGLAVKTIKDMIVVLKMCIKDYEEQHELTSRRYSIRYPITYEKGGIEVWSKEEQGRVLELVEKNLNSETLGYAIALCTGMRIGELCALKWSDIDLLNRVIHIDKTLQRIYLKTEIGRGRTKVIITTPKSEKSVRSVPISSTLLVLLEQMKKGDEKYVLTGESTYIEPRVYREHYRKFITKYGITPIKFHALRHTFATRCIENGADYKIVSELLGHSSVNLTLNLYVHPNMEDKRRCVELGVG